MKSHWKNRPACSTHFAWKPEDSVSKHFRSLHLLELTSAITDLMKLYSPDLCHSHLQFHQLPGIPKKACFSWQAAMKARATAQLLLTEAQGFSTNGTTKSTRHLLPKSILIHRKSQSTNAIDENGKNRIKQILFADVRRPRRQGWVYLPSYQVLQRSLPLDDLFLYKLPWHTKWLKHPARNISMT